MLSERLSDFALDGSRELAAGGGAHEHFNSAILDETIWKDGFCVHAAENQAPNWSFSDEDAILDQILATMMAEGLGGSHHDVMLDRRYSRVGIGLVVDGGKLWLTNDFSQSCPQAAIMFQ